MNLFYTKYRLYLKQPCDVTYYNYYVTNRDLLWRHLSKLFMTSHIAFHRWRHRSWLVMNLFPSLLLPTYLFFCLLATEVLFSSSFSSTLTNVSAFKSAVKIFWGFSVTPVQKKSFTCFLRLISLKSLWYKVKKYFCTPL